MTTTRWPQQALPSQGAAIDRQKIGKFALPGRRGAPDHRWRSTRTPAPASAAFSDNAGTPVKVQVAQIAYLPRIALKVTKDTAAPNRLRW